MEDDNSQEMEELAHVTLPIHTLSGEYGYGTSEDDDEEGVQPLFPTEIVNVNDQQSTTHTPGWVDVMQRQAVTRNAQLEMQLQQDVLRRDVNETAIEATFQTALRRIYGSSEGYSIAEAPQFGGMMQHGNGIEKNKNEKTASDDDDDEGGGGGVFFQKNLAREEEILCRVAFVDTVTNSRIARDSSPMEG